MVVSGRYKLIIRFDPSRLFVDGYRNADHIGGLNRELCSRFFPDDDPILIYVYIR